MVHEINEIRLLRSLIENIDNPDNFPAEAYFRQHGSHIIYMLGSIDTKISVMSRRLAINRSWDFFNTVAETFGVTINRYTSRDYDEVVRFSHRGLEFELFAGGMRINIREINKQIRVCVVDEKKLPIGDFYATMLGLIVAKPEELDVVNFGIQLGLIMLSYSGYDWRETPSQIGIFTPFEARNSENLSFVRMLNKMGEDDHDLAPDILEEIEGALEDCFGSTRGFS